MREVSKDKSSKFGYPPDNAALLYYRVLVDCLDTESVRDELRAYVEGVKELNGKMAHLIERHQRAIEIAITAADIPDCHWGLNLEDGPCSILQPLNEFKDLVRLVLMQARMFSKQGNNKSALDRCLTAFKMARHIGNDVLVLFVWNISLNNESSLCIKDILVEISGDFQILDWFKSKLAAIEFFSFASSFESEIEHELNFLRVENKETLAIVLKEIFEEEQEKLLQSIPDKGKSLLEGLIAEEKRLFQKARDYYHYFNESVLSASRMPYSQAYTKLKQIRELALSEAQAGSNSALLTYPLMPATNAPYSIAVKAETLFNAIKTAVDIYIAKAQTGKLPDELPKDLFSGKDFEYEKIADGFILCCRGRDLLKDEFHEYEFKVAK